MVQQKVHRTTSWQNQPTNQPTNRPTNHLTKPLDQIPFRGNRERQEHDEDHHSKAGSKIKNVENWTGQNFVDKWKAEKKKMRNNYRLEDISNKCNVQALYGPWFKQNNCIKILISKKEEIINFKRHDTMVTITIPWL